MLSDVVVVVDDGYSQQATTVSQAENWLDKHHIVGM
jgi:hypothetical protein